MKYRVITQNRKHQQSHDLACNLEIPDACALGDRNLNAPLRYLMVAIVVPVRSSVGATDH